MEKESWYIKTLNTNNNSSRKSAPLRSSRPYLLNLQIYRINEELCPQESPSQLSGGWLEKTVSLLWVFMEETKELLCGIAESNGKEWVQESTGLSIWQLWSLSSLFEVECHSTLKFLPCLQRTEMPTKFWGSSQKFTAGIPASWPTGGWRVTSDKGCF